MRAELSSFNTTGDPQNIQITGLSAGERHALEQTYGIRLTTPCICRCSLSPPSITPRLEAAAWSEGALHVCFIALKRYSVRRIYYLKHVSGLRLFGF